MFLTFMSKSKIMKQTGIKLYLFKNGTFGMFMSINDLYTLTLMKPTLFLRIYEMLYPYIKRKSLKCLRFVHRVL
jgi:hypothetical protein